MKVCEQPTFFQAKVSERGTSSLKMVYKRVRGWTLGRDSSEMESPGQLYMEGMR